VLIRTRSEFAAAMPDVRPCADIGTDKARAYVACRGTRGFPSSQPGQQSDSPHPARRAIPQSESCTAISIRTVASPSERLTMCEHPAAPLDPDLIPQSQSRRRRPPRDSPIVLAHDLRVDRPRDTDGRHRENEADSLCRRVRIEGDDSRRMYSMAEAPTIRSVFNANSTPSRSPHSLRMRRPLNACPDPDA
jgi:hypothetical protein